MTIHSQVINKLPANDRLGLSVSLPPEAAAVALDISRDVVVQEKVKHLTFINYYYIFIYNNKLFTFIKSA